MSKRGSAGPPTRSEGMPAEGMAAEPTGLPPPSPLDAAAAAAREAAATAPQPQPSTSKGALEGAVHWMPGALQPAGMLAVGLGKALWTAAVPLASLTYRILVWISPVLLWAAMKYFNWYIGGMLAKATRVLKWGRWLLSFFAKAPPAA